MELPIVGENPGKKEAGNWILPPPILQAVRSYHTAFFSCTKIHRYQRTIFTTQLQKLEEQSIQNMEKQNN
jgi:hypothetical protein